MENIQKQREVLRALINWRDKTAKDRGVPEYLILPNTTINAIAQALPKNESELIQVKGIKEGKLREFGKSILSIVGGTSEQDQLSDDAASEDTPRINNEQANALSVSAYLDSINFLLQRGSRARVSGEVTSFKIQGKAIYFAIKDKHDDSLLNSFMWLRDYEMCGVTADVGLEVILEGVGDIYKPFGRFSFRAETIELVGEGALKQAYEALKKKLALEGIFDQSRKRSIPDFPERIGLITSKTGAVIHDFSNNLGRYGYSIRFIDSRVEGQIAIRDLLSALETMRHEPIDVLVLIRGGGSLESLQAFNNEQIVRTLAAFPVPVICAIGHDQDVPLAQLVADAAPSTPTACTTIINRSWEHAERNYQLIWKSIIESYQEALFKGKETLTTLEHTFERQFSLLLRSVDILKERVVRHAEKLHDNISKIHADCALVGEKVLGILESRMTRVRDELSQTERLLKQSDPRRLLELGYALLRSNGQIMKTVTQIKTGQHFSVEMKDGTIDAQVNEIHQHDR